jgi:hypothetical protein
MAASRFRRSSQWGRAKWGRAQWGQGIYVDAATGGTTGGASHHAKFTCDGEGEAVVISLGPLVDIECVVGKTFSPLAAAGSNVLFDTPIAY